MEDTNATTFAATDSPVTTVGLDTITFPPSPPPLPPSASPGGPPTDSTSFSSPVSVLPLVISLATLVTIIIAACIIYRNRQNKRSQELARQLRVTERKIDVIGNLKAKKEQELLGLTIGGKRRAEYLPPATAPCSSATSLETHANRNLGVKFTVPVQHIISHHVKEGDHKQATCTTSSTEYELKVCEASIEANKAPSSTATSTYTSTQSQEGKENEGGSSSYYCSTCQDSTATGSSKDEAECKRKEVEVGNSSLAVECETIPTASSLSTVIGTVLSQPNHVTRSQSEHHHVNPNKRPKRLSTISAWTQVQNYSHLVRNFRYGSKYRSTHPSNSKTASKAAATNSTVPHSGSWGATNHIYSTINPPPSLPTAAAAATEVSFYPVPPPQSYGSRTISSSRREEGSGRPNTPVSHVTDTTTTDTDGEKEKWV